MTIEQIKTAYNQIKPLLQNEHVKRYGTMLFKAGKSGAKKLVGHIETTKSNQRGIITSTSAVGNTIQTQLAGSMSGMTQQLIQKGCSSALGSLTSLSWANLAISGINLGVTAVGMVVISKKISALSREVQQMNGKLDVILDEMHQIKAMVAQLNDNEIRKLYNEANLGIRRMKDLSLELSQRYDNALRREAKNQLTEASVFLEDILGRYTDSTCDIALGLDIIMAYFYTFVSLLKSYISAVYLYDQNLFNYTEYENSLRSLCSKSMIDSIQNAYRQSADSFISPQDLGLITAVYKGIMVEQISEIKSQRKILELVDYNEYKRINEQLQEGEISGEVAFVQYAS